MVTERMSGLSRGFTLVEAIVAIVIMGILGGVVATFIKAPIDAYIAESNRAVLTDAADAAIRRIARDIAAALPNSLRSTSGGSTSCIELLPVVGGGRYRYQNGTVGAGDILDFTTNDTSFDILGQVNLGNLPSGTNYVAIYNLGILGADAYAGNNTSAITSASTTQITIAAKQFPFTSPAKAFSVIPSTSVVYFCSGNGLYRTTQAISGTKMAACPTTGGTLVVDNVSSCNFHYLQAVNERDGIIGLSLALTLNGETINLYEQVMVNNVP